ncbi:hypothetical protein F5884DRAFT_120025 [Xylogone sp. PMI_703]|nr:hypothetical protein F5884DRAFT_120025 [Xylogone sp. PMI_703]
MCDIHQTINTDFIKAARSLNITPATFIYASFAILLSQSLAQTTVTFLILCSNRDISVDGIERMYGPSFNGVPISVGLGSDRTIRELCAKLQQDSVYVSKFSQHLVESAGKTGDITPPPFDSMVNILLQPPIEAKEEDTEDRDQSYTLFKKVKERSVHSGVNKLILREEPRNTFTLYLESAMEETKAHAFLKQLLFLIEEISRDGNTRIGELRQQAD